MSFISDLFSGGASQLVDSVGKVLDNVVTTKEEKMTLENEMKKAEMQYQLEAKKLDIQEQEIYTKDAQNARDREKDIQSNVNATKLGKNVSSYLAIGATILCFSMFACELFIPGVFDDKNKEMVFYVLGVLSTLLTQVYGYYFGSSAGSSAKSQTISQALDKK
jgi:hypothetical protein